MLLDPGKITNISNLKLKKKIDTSINKLETKNILDFGVGTNKLYKILQYNKYFIYDVNTNFSNYHNENDDIIILKDYKKIKDHIDIIFFNSVIQYIDLIELESILLHLSKTSNITILINDIPYYDRFIEFFLIFFKNFRYSTLIYKNILYNIFFNKLFSNKFYFHKKQILIDLFIKLGFKVSLNKNYYINNSRYTLILKKK